MTKQTTIEDANPKLTRSELRTARAGANLWAGAKFQAIIRELRTLPVSDEARQVYRSVLAEYLRIVDESLVSEEQP